MILCTLTGILTILILIHHSTAGLAVIFNNCAYPVDIMYALLSPSPHLPLFPPTNKIPSTLPPNSTTPTTTYLSPTHLWTQPFPTTIPFTQSIYIRKSSSPSNPHTIFQLQLSLTPSPTLFYRAFLHNCLPLGLDKCAGADGGLVLEPNDEACNSRPNGRAYCGVSDPGEGCILLPESDGGSVGESVRKSRWCGNLRADLTMTLCSG